MKKDHKAKTFIGKVVSFKMQKTVVVEVERKITHPLYKKVLKRSRNFKADTNSLELALGDKVKVVETKPYSKDKYFKVERKISE